MTKKAKKAKKGKRIKRPPRIFVDNKGRYLKFKGKRVYLESGLTNNQLVRVIINNFQKTQRKKKKRPNEMLHRLRVLVILLLKK